MSVTHAQIAEDVVAFEDGTLSPGRLDHTTHVQIAWWMLRDATALAGLARFDAAVRRYAVHIGKPELYHATITWAYLLAIAERLEARGRERTWDEFARDEPDLLDRQLLRVRYRPETLASPLAKRVFVFPDAPEVSDRLLD